MVTTASHKMNANADGSLLSDEQAELYDRQIRLWGVEVQKRLNSARLLILGMGGLGSEVAKNIILGGLKSVTLMDCCEVTPGDYTAQIFIPQDSIGKNRAEASLDRAKRLNPMVNVTAVTSNPADKPDEFFLEFEVICVLGGCSVDQMIRINRIARGHNIKYFAGDVFGFFSFLFSDLGEHTYRKEFRIPATKMAPETVKVMDGTVRYIPLQDLLNIDWTVDIFHKRIKKITPNVFVFFILMEFVTRKGRKPLMSLRETDYKELLGLRDEYISKHGISKDRVPDEKFSFVFGELNPECASTGGVLSQEIVKAITNDDKPWANLYVGDMDEISGIVVDFTTDA